MKNSSGSHRLYETPECRKYFSLRTLELPFALRFICFHISLNLRARGARSHPGVQRNFEPCVPGTSIFGQRSAVTCRLPGGRAEGAAAAAAWRAPFTAPFTATGAALTTTGLARAVGDTATFAAAAFAAAAFLPLFRLTLAAC